MSYSVRIFSVVETGALLARCLIYARALKEYISSSVWLFIEWLRSFSRCYLP